MVNKRTLEKPINTTGELVLMSIEYMYLDSAHGIEFC